MIPIARMLEKTYNIFGPYGMKVPQLTPSRIRLLTCNRTFSSRKANDRLAYVLIVPLQEGLKQTIESYSGLRAERLPRKEGPSKAALFLGNEIVADILLWREKTMTCTAMVGLVVFYLSFVKLHLERNSMSLLLSNIDEMDTDEITQPVEKVEVDIALSAHVNARRWYEEKKKQKSKQEKTHTAHTKAFKAAEKKTRSSNNSLNQSPHQQTTLAAILSAFRTRVEHGGPLVVSYKSPQLYFFYMYIMLL